MKPSQGPYYLDIHGRPCASISGVECTLLWGCALAVQPEAPVLWKVTSAQGGLQWQRGNKNFTVSELLHLAQGTSSFINVIGPAMVQTQNGCL